MLGKMVYRMISSRQTIATMRRSAKDMYHAGWIDGRCEIDEVRQQRLLHEPTGFDGFAYAGCGRVRARDSLSRSFSIRGAFLYV